MRPLHIARAIAISFSLAVATSVVVAQTTQPADGAERSADFAVSIDGVDAFVRPASVAVCDAETRAKVVDDFPHFGTLHETAAFAAFDIANAPTEVVVTYKAPIRELHVLPASAGITPIVDGTHATFRVDRPMNLTLEINGDIVRSLHLFANPAERETPNAHDPNVIYYGAGVHQIDKPIDVGDGKTLYLAAGAILRATSDGDGQPVVRMHGKHPAVRGRGVIDGSRCSIHSRLLIECNDAQDITIEGVTLLDPPGWTMPVRRCDRVTIDDVKIIGFRANSDGIDLCNSRGVHVRNCFIRTSDDLVVIKSDEHQGKVADIDVRGCVLWNQFAHALSIGAELHEDVERVTFADCDVIHDVGREWTLRIYHCDDATIRDVTFQNISVTESPRMISLWIGKAFWSRAEARGHITNVTFRDIASVRGAGRVALEGADEAHAVEGVRLERVTIAGTPLSLSMIERNPFAHGISITP